MVNCGGIAGIIIGICAVAAQIASLPGVLIWLNPTINSIVGVEYAKELKLCYHTLPIIGTVIAGLAVLLAVIDLKTKKCIVKTLVWIFFLTAAGCMAYSGGYFLWRVITAWVAKITSEDAVNGLLDSQKSELAALLGVEVDQINAHWNAAANILDNWSNINMWGPVAAIIASAVNIVAAIFYACLSCCASGQK